MSTIGSALQGKLDFSNPNTLSEISAQDPKLGEALDEYNNNKNSNVKDEDATFADATEKIFNSKNKQEITDYTMKVLKEGNISQDRLNILVGSAMDRGKNLPDLDGQSKASNPIQDSIDAGVKHLMNWGKEQGTQDAGTMTDFLGGVKTKPVDQAINDAKINTLVKNNPSLATINKEKYA
jgi:hypothetical protein